MGDTLTTFDVDDFVGAKTCLTDHQVAAAVQMVRIHCRWHIAPQRTETIVVDGECGTELMVPSGHLSDVTEIRVDGEPDTSVQWWRNGRLRRSAGFTDDPRLVEIDAAHGHAWADVPEVVGVVAALATRVSSATSTDPEVAEEAIGSFRVRYATGREALVAMDEAELLMLGPHRLPLDP